MSNKLMIRKTVSADFTQVLALYPQAFPEDDLRPVVSALLEDESDILSLAAFEGNALVGHVVFTICGTEEGDRTGALLAPLGVLPLLQRQGLGNSLVRTGLQRLENSWIKQVFVLGDPAYYRRFDFSPERRVLPPYPIPEQWADAWQSVPLATRAPLAAGRLLLPEPWMEPALWAP